MENKRTEQISKLKAFIEKQKNQGVDNLTIWSKVNKNKSKWSCITDFEKRYYIFGN